MDSLILDLLALVTFILFIVAALIIGRNIKKTESTPKLPPGPWKLPIIGSIHHLVTSNPHRKLRDLANIYGPLMHLQLGEVLTIVISSPEYAREVMKTHDLVFASRPKILAMEIMSYDSTNIVFAPYGNYWRQLRKICTLELFTTKRVKSFQPIREGELTNLVTRIASVKGSTVNLTEEVLSSIYTINSRAAFGIKCKDQEKYISVIKEGITVAAGFDLGDLFPSSNWLQLISGLRPKLERINELKYLKSVVKETLRLHPAAPLLLPRECREACEINGYHIPVKSKVIVNAWAIGRDPNYWVEPERFYPERFIDSTIDYKGSNFEYIPFGAGRRICPGSTLGLINVEMALAYLLYHFDWELPNGVKCEDLNMTEQFGMTVGRKDDLQLIPIASRYLQEHK